ncbi:hypothetical protein [Streptomyces achromogenes]|uniref:hypothetical protein n=1 Tax=Streptomyces achromogenes TaxID=67255 RepID=UPI0036FBF897
MRTTGDHVPHPTASLTAAAWRQLTSQPVKRTMYTDEPHVARGWRSATQSLGPRPGWMLQRTALALLRPDALYAQRVDDAISYIAGLGMEPVFAAEVRFTARSAASMWKYQWGGASADRTALMTTLLTAGPSVLVAFRDRADSIRLPSSVRLSAVKGSGHPGERTGGELRSALRSPNRVLTFVHVADEPADILRESAILLGDDERRRLFSALGPGMREMPRLPAASAPPPDLDGGRALARITATVRAAPVDGDDGARAHLLALLEQVRAGERLAWQPFRHAVARSRLAVPLWDQLLAGAAHISYDSLDGRAVISDSGRSGWLAGNGTVLSDAAADVGSRAEEAAG